MGMHQFAQTQTVPGLIQNLPPVGVMVPTGIAMLNRHGNAPAHAGFFRRGPDNARPIGHHLTHAKGDDKPKGQGKSPAKTICKPLFHTALYTQNC